METCAQRVVLDAHLSTEVHDKPIERNPLGRSHVGRRDHAESHPAVTKVRELALEEANAMPLHEGAEEIDVIRAGDLCAQLTSHGRFAVGVRQQSCL